MKAAIIPGQLTCQFRFNACDFLLLNCLLVGTIGQIKEIEQQKMLMLEGDLWPIGNPEGLQQGQAVKVVEVKDGILTVGSSERNL